MARRQATQAKLAAIIKPYGLHIEQGKKHNIIYDLKGNRVYSMSITPSCQYFADNTLRDLARAGLIPQQRYRCR